MKDKKLHTPHGEASDPLPGELPDDELDGVAGGIQAGFVTGGGSGEFGHSGKPAREETEEERHRRLMLELEGSTYL